MSGVISTVNGRDEFDTDLYPYHRGCIITHEADAVNEAIL